MSRVRRGRLAPRSKATGRPRAQNKKVGRISLKKSNFFNTLIKKAEKKEKTMEKERTGLKKEKEE
jgi:hypothetical protein